MPSPYLLGYVEANEEVRNVLLGGLPREAARAHNTVLAASVTVITSGGGGVDRGSQVNWGLLL